TTAVLLARVLASTSRPEEAEQVLRDNEQRFPRGDTIRRERENLLRGPLQQPVAADELALERLANAPATLDNTIELAEVQARLRRARATLLSRPHQQHVAADELALERIANAPATLDNAIELAEVQARLGRWTDAAASLERALSNAGVSLRRDQRDRVARALGFF